jgi:hypothetical protein
MTQTFTSAKRNAIGGHTRLTFDDFGVGIETRVRLTGVSAEVRELLQAAPPERQDEVITQSMSLGLTTLAAAADVTISSAVQRRLAEAAECVSQTMDRLDLDQRNRDEKMQAEIRKLFENEKFKLSSARDEDQRMRVVLHAHADELGKAAQRLDVSRSELERRSVKATQDLLQCQITVKTEMLSSVEATLRKLIDPADPGSAPTIVQGVVDRAAADLRAITTKNVGALETTLATLLGEGSPFARRIAQTAREDAAHDLQHITGLLGTLRTDLTVASTRLQHDPVVKGDSYEERLCSLLEPGASAYGLTVHGTGRDIGTESGSKKGDLLLIDEAMAPKIGIEARARKGVSLRSICEELEGTARNRNVKVVAYLVPTVAHLPGGVSEFVRGELPFTYKRLPGDVHALIAVLDPEGPAVAERVAVLLWVLDRIARSTATGVTAEGLSERVADALARVEQTVQHLSTFRSIKSNLTGASTAIEKARDNVTRVEEQLQADLAYVQSQLEAA